LVRLADLRAEPGVSPVGKNRLQFVAASGRERRLGTLPGVGVYDAKHAIGRAKFRAYMLLTNP
jgi:hypothetical protein